MILVVVLSVEVTLAIVLGASAAAAATQTPAPGFDPVPILQYGVLAFVLILLLTGYLWAKPAVDEMRARQAEERKIWQDEVIPAIKDLTAAVKDVKGELQLRRRSGHADG